MKKNRIIPILLLKNGWLVQSKGFNRYQNLGNPVTAVKRLSEWAVDELVYLDITTDDVYDLRRNDIKNENRGDFLSIIEDVSKFSFMPITVGGKITSLEDIEKRLSKGADKISINTKAIEDPSFIETAAKEFGSQCIVISLDAKITDEGYKIFKNGGKANTKLDVSGCCRKVQDLGAGEILINSIDRDGAGNGYDIELINEACEAVNIPVIAVGGVGEWSHFSEGFEKTNADAFGAANIFHYQDQSVYLAKKYLFDKGYNVRKPALLRI